MTTGTSGRAIAWGSFLLGISVSVAGNVLHASLMPASAGMMVARLTGAAFWPLALLASIEVLTRVSWPSGRRWSWARFGGVGAVATVAAVLSYRHLSGLMLAFGEDHLNAYLGPLAIDGLLILSTAALLAISRQAAALLSISKESTEVQVVTPIVAEALVEKVVEQTNAPASKPVIKPRRIEPVTLVNGDAKRQAAWQAWTTAPHDSKPTVSQLAELSGLPRSTAGKLAKDWRELNGAAR